jgi:predicted NBD/HSP70 family sugar kinase
LLRLRVHGLIRSHGPLSRAEIARQLRVSKPTVTMVVRHLMALGLVVETDRAPSVGGRRGTGLVIEPSARTVIGIDVGATNTRAAIADAQGRLLATSRVRTDGSSEASLRKQLVVLRDELVQRSGAAEPGSIAIGTPGVVDPESGVVRYAPNLPILERPGVGRRIMDALRTPATLHNDVNLAAIGEHWRGAGRGLQTFILLGIGTGLGVGLIVDGELFTGAFGRAGESSLTRIHPCRPRTIEDVVSGAGIARRHAAAGGSGRPEDAFAEADAGVQPGAAVVGEFVRYLAWVIASHTTMLDPQRVVVGGGIGRRLHPYLLRLRELVQAYGPYAAEIVVSDQEDWSGLYGAVWSALWSDERRLLRQLVPRSEASSDAIAYSTFRDSMARLGRTRIDDMDASQPQTRERERVMGTTA